MTGDRVMIDGVRRERRLVLSPTERLTVAAVAGVTLACIAYFWANRLLPHDLSARAHWEAGVFFASWSATLLHALGRPPACAWREHLWRAPGQAAASRCSTG